MSVMGGPVVGKGMKTNRDYHEMVKNSAQDLLTVVLSNVDNRFDP
jgi:hypothetical protein